MIKRHIQAVIEQAIEDYPVVLLTGPRQIGKSTLLYQTPWSKKYSYISFDDSLVLMQAKSDPRAFLDLHPTPLIIDEAQNVPELFPEIERRVNRSRLEKGDEASSGMYILSGSQRKKLLEQSEESLAGRVAVLDMTNLSLNEIKNRPSQPFKVEVMTNATRCKDFRLDEAELYEYIYRGFFPFLHSKKRTVGTFYSSYLTTYLQKDLREIVEVTDEMKFINFLKILASNTGQELVYDNYANQVGITSKTVKAWVSALCKSEIIYLVEPYNEESIVKRVIKRPKMYFFDTGLVCYLCDIDSPKTLMQSFLKGRLFETFVVNEIRKTYINAGIMQPLYYYRDTSQNEVDLILIQSGTLSCIEIKAGQTFSKSATKSFKELDVTRLIRAKDAIISTGEDITMVDEKTLVLPISAI